MDNIQIIQASQQNFKEFIFNKQRNRLILYIAVAAIVIQFAIFKYLYPFASYIHGDSFSYLEAAAKNMDINTYPIGYSRFLRLFSVITSSDTALVAFQYVFIQASMLLLLFTIFYFYKAGKTIQYILFVFMVFNPLFLHLANLVSSDCVFVGLSLIWFTLMLWIIHRPSNKIIIWHAVVLFMAFTVRYNAIIYPAIAGIAFSLSRLPIRKKIAGIGVGVLLCALFICYTSYKYQKLTKLWQFSPFTGWLLANNVMYMYKHIDSIDRKLVPQKFKALDNMIWNFHDKNRQIRAIAANPEFNEASTVYMWSPGMPLMNYRDSLFKKAKDTIASEQKKWASMGPFYKAYGMYMIKQYSWQYIWYYARYNARKYYAPPIEFLKEYNSGKKEVPSLARTWFSYKNNKVKVRMGDSKVWILDFYPILSGIINVIMLFGLLYYVLLKGWQHNLIFNRTIIIAGTVWMLNALFTIMVSSAALRFQSFPVLLTTTFALLLIDWMAQLMRKMKLEADMKKTEALRSEGIVQEQALA